MVSKAATVFVPVYPLSAHVVVPLYNLVVTTMFLLLMLCLLSGIQKNFRDYRGLSKQTNWLVAMSIQFGSRYFDQASQPVESRWGRNLPVLTAASAAVHLAPHL